MAFEGFAVNRVIMHEVHKRAGDNAVPPTYGANLIQLQGDALLVFRDRVVAAVGSASQSMELDIGAADAASAVAIARDLMLADNAQFVQHSRRFADKLTDAQVSRALPGGIVVVFSGTAGNPARQVVGVIKAETHGGFRRLEDMNIQYLKDLFMTPQTKLYKIGVFQYGGALPPPDLPQGWSAIVYDSQLTPGNRDGAAKYFYDTFLGCKIPMNAAQMTKRFYEGTHEFIMSLPVAPETKSDLVTGLYTYLKVDQAATVEVAVFSGQYLDPGHRDAYAAFMQQKAFPANAVPKDTSDIQGRLRQRRIKFSRNIQLTAPQDAFEEMVEIRTIHPDNGGADGAHTQITIRDHIRDQE